MKLCVLAAGQGKRLGISGPKTLISLGDCSLIEHLLERFAVHAIDEIVIVIGHDGERIRLLLGDYWNSRPIRYVWNRDFATTENGESLKRAMPFLKGDAFWLADGDVYLADGILPRTVSEQSVLLISDHACDDEAMKAYVDGDGFLSRAEKQAHPELRCAGETIGVQYIDADLSARLEEVLDAQSYYEAALNRLVERGARIGITAIPENGWKEIDTPEDLSAAREIRKAEANAVIPILSAFIAHFNGAAEAERLVVGPRRSVFLPVFIMIQVALIAAAASCFATPDLASQIFFAIVAAFYLPLRRFVGRALEPAHLRHVRLLDVVGDLLIVGVFAPGWAGIEFLLTAGLAAVVFLYTYSAIAYLLILPASIRDGHPAALIKANRLYLRSGALYRPDRELMLVPLLLFPFLFPAAPVYAGLIILGLAHWALQNRVLWRRFVGNMV
jgi:choline kinase